MKSRDLAKTLNALGLSARARGLILGTPMICDALQSPRKPRLVVCASDNSENTAKRLSDRCAFYGVPTVMLECDGERLAHAVGKTARLAAVAVSDENLCRLVCGTLEQETNT